MILDSYKLLNAIIQIQYKEAFEIWDNAGTIARRLCTIWPNLTLSQAQPHEQTLVGKDVSINIGIVKSTITLSGEKSLDKRNIEQIHKTFEIWRKALDLKDLVRVSTRVTYFKEFPSIKDANVELISLNLGRWPKTKVFDQSTDSDLNSLEMLYRFQDKESFSILKLKTEQISFEANLDPYFVEQPQIRKVKNRIIIDFDRGILGSVNADKLRMDDWIKGFQHVLRRDIEKVIQEQV